MEAFSAFWGTGNKKPFTLPRLQCLQRMASRMRARAIRKPSGPIGGIPPNYNLDIISRWWWGGGGATTSPTNCGTVMGPT